MFNNRQFQIIELLRNKDVSAEKISKIVKKSIRTVMRDITLIKEYFEENDIGKIISSNEKGGYELVVKDKEKLDEVMKDWVDDNETIIYLLLMNKYVTIDEISEQLYLSNPIISDKLSALKELYRGSINIEATHFGHLINEDNRKKIILLSNLIEKNYMYYLKKIGLKETDYNRLIRYFNENKISINSEYSNINSRQFISVVLAVYHLFKDGNGLTSKSWIVDIYKDNGLDCNDDIVKNLELVIEYVTEKNKKVTRGTILDIFLDIEDKYETNIYDMELVKQLVLHIKRSIAYPYILKQSEIYNISNIKARNPFAFDLSILFSNILDNEIDFNIVNNELVGLYFICALERMKNSKYKILILAEQISFAIINRQVIEDSIANVDVEIVSSNSILREKIKGENIGLIINNKSSLKVDDLDIKVIEVNQIISSKEVKTIKDIIDNLNLKDSIDDIFSRDFSFEYKVNRGEIWSDVIENICLRLKNNSVINEEEANLIVTREKQDNLLIINNISIPHCISKREDICIGVYVSLSETMKIEGEDVKNLIIMCLDPKNKNNNKIFGYIYKRLNSYKGTLQLNGYDEFIKMMKASENDDRF